jgi:acylphosphatase
VERDPTVIRHVVIRGRVQGVGYRAWTEYTAIDQGLDGWVRNRRDGSVEAVFAGPSDAVEQMVDACRRGPPGARVDAIDARDGTKDELALRGRVQQFAVLPTA